MASLPRAAAAAGAPHPRVYSQPPQSSASGDSGPRSPGDSPLDGPEEQHPPRTKRRRIGYACNLCRAKKNRCDGERPTCGPCRGRRQECVYSPQRTRVSVTQEYVDSLRERNRELEEHLALQHRRALPPPETPIPEGAPYALHPAPTREDSSEIPRPQWPRRPPSPPRQPAAEYNGKRSPATLPRRYLDGRQPVEEQKPAAPGLPNYRRPKADERSPGEYFGESSAFDFIARVGSPNNTSTATAVSGIAGESSAGASSVDAVGPLPVRRSLASSGHQRPLGAARAAAHGHAESLAGSSPSTVVFEEFLGAVGHGGGNNPFELPQRHHADRLVSQYFAHRHPLNPYLHEPTFRRRYERLWLSQGEGGEEATLHNVVWLGLVNLLFAFGSETGAGRVVAPSSSTASAASAPSSHSDRDRTRFFERAKTLVLSGILQAGKIELVQALLLMGHYLHGSLELNHCWTVVGLAVRTAQELGLHLDPAQVTADIVEQEVRKRVWWGCFALDRQISTKVGRPPVINDGAAIRAGLPLAVDDEYLDEASGFRQPEGVPSKLEFFKHIVGQCRLVEKVLDTLYSNRGAGPVTSSLSAAGDAESRMRVKTDLPDLLAMSIQLDGALIAWQDGLPPHLRPDSDAPQWHFERQKSVLLMRFLHTRLLIHRQTLLHYISRRISDPFQLDLIRLCIRRCVLAAYETITQMRLLRQRKSLSSLWHNSHYVFAALGVLLVYQKIDSQSRAGVGIPASVDLDEVIDQGLENLQRVGGEMHPLAFRYVQSFKQLQIRLQGITTLSANAPQAGKLPPTRSGTNTPGPRSAAPPWDPHYANGSSNALPTAGAAGKDASEMDDQRQDGASYYAGDAGPEGVDPFTIPGFDDEFEILQSVLLDSGDWPVFMDFDWQQG